MIILRGFEEPMHIVIHDYSGHPFQAQLARLLANRGYTITHLSSADYVSGKGDIERHAGDPSILAFAKIKCRSFHKYDAWDRLLHERAYARGAARFLAKIKPDILVNCNVPLFAHLMLQSATRSYVGAEVLWHQDIYSAAIRSEAIRRWGPRVGGGVGQLAQRTEARIARNAAHVIAITDRFLETYQRWGLSDRSYSVIPNWAPLDAVRPTVRENPWAKQHGLVNVPVLMYAGTLGAKHDHLKLEALINAVRRHQPDVLLVVVSEGPSADTLKQHLNFSGSGIVLPFQPIARLSDVLGSADLLICALEEEASQYSVPSKALTYLCAGRPILGLLPRTNPAANYIVEGGGLLVDTPIEHETVGRQVASLLSDKASWRSRGRRARAVAEREFDVDRIINRFIAVFERVEYSGQSTRFSAAVHPVAERAPNT